MMANHDVEKGGLAVPHRAEAAAEAAVNEKQAEEEGRSREDGLDDRPKARLLLLWHWTKQHRAPVVALVCFVTVRALTVLMPLLVEGRTGSDLVCMDKSWADST